MVDTKSPAQEYAPKIGPETSSHEVQECLDRMDGLASRRLFMETTWNDVARTSFPTAEDMFRLGSSSPSGRSNSGFDSPIGSYRSRSIYDSVGVVASERLTSGLESLITPSAERWHSFMLGNTTEEDPDNAEIQEWSEAIRDFLFETRYDPMSGFPLSNQRSMRSMVGFGHGVMFVEEAFGMHGRSAISLPIAYQYIPTAECYIDVDPRGVHDTLYRSFWRSALQVVKQFGDATSLKTKNMANNPTTADQKVELVHAVYPEVEGLEEYDDNESKPWTSMYIERENKHLLRKGGYYEFPYIIYPWSPIDGSAYAEGPAMLALAELKSLQAMGRDTLIASQLGIRPPLASAYSPDVPININPGSVNAKMVDPNTGRLLVQPIFAPPQINLSMEIMEMRRAQIKDSMYLNLFQTMADKTTVMSATEVMARANERGMFLGPVASRVQAALSRMVDRELAILERKGAFRKGSRYAPPEVLAGKKITVKFSAPVDRLRRASDVTGITHTLEIMTQMAQLDPQVVDNLDSDAALEVVRERLGAPRKIMRTPEEVKALREQRAQQEAAKNAMVAANSMADTANKAAPAVETMANLMNGAGGMGATPSGSGGLPGMPLGQ
jgi:hypothetical protein